MVEMQAGLRNGGGAKSAEGRLSVSESEHKRIQLESGELQCLLLTK